MILRAHVKLDNLTSDEAHDVRVAVERWAAARPHLEPPTVVHFVAPTAGLASVGADWCELRRWATVSVLDPTPDDLLALSFVVAPWAWPDLPRLTLSREPDPMEA